jgi:hypothetical protein
MKILLIILTFIISNHAFCAPRNRMKGAEYIVTANKETKLEAISMSFKGLSPDLIKPLGNGQYLIHFKNDPGLIKLKSLSKQNFNIQPNFKYKVK